SGRVQAGCFGAALMANPALVAECVQAMRDASGLPVTVKTRLGIDDLDSYSHLCEFVAAVAAAGCRTVFVHARKAWLSGLSPKENRDIPPLDYKRVHRLKQDFPELEIVINGGLSAVDTATAQLEHVDGVMLGRAVYRDPYLFAALDAQLFGGVLPSRAAVLEAMLRYAASEVAKGTPLRAITRHLMGLYAGLPGARGWRRTLGELDDGVGGLRQLEQTVVERLVA
ncbi:MAG: tRNA dihydrouridine(20/20a) synthase DusA, partial [Gammaproteobacteria bacterium]|nr:tRNA dihydrouridine(20/20a) synthase DusA [Gammaproteobacteria bacterium]